MKKTRVLILGASHSEYPIARACADLGMQVFMVGMNIFDPCRQYTHQIFETDYSSAKVVTELLNLWRIEHIIPGANDFAYLNSSRVAEKTGISKGIFDNEHIATTLHHKNKFRQLMLDLALNVPRFWNVRSKIDLREINYSSGALLLKPVDLSGGKGINFISSENGALEAFDGTLAMSRQSSILVEEYWKGSDYSSQIFIEQCRVTSSVYAKEYHFPSDPFHIQGAHTDDELTFEDKRSLEQQVEAIAMHLALNDGFLWVQFKKSERNGISIIEMSRRLAGDRLLDIFKHQYNYDLYHDYAYSMILGSPDYREKRAKDDFYTCRLCIWGNVNDPIDLNITGHDIEVLERIDLRQANPSILESTENRKSKIGIVVFKSNDQTLRKDLENGLV